MFFKLNKFDIYFYFIFFKNMTGSVKIIIGSMFSGKSTEVIRLIDRYKLLKKNVLAINHTLDDRYDKNKIVTHNKVKKDCLSVSELMPLLNTVDYIKSDVVVIEEAQFFKDLFNFVVKSSDENNKIVVVAGLDGNYKREPFGDILNLIPYAESVIKLHALCMKCGDGTKASFTKRINTDNEEILIGSTEEYVPVCRKHYLE